MRTGIENSSHIPRWCASLICFLVLIASAFTQSGNAQVNSGSDGHDGAFNPTTNTVIDMADHPDGIYHYTSVSIPAGVTVSFTPNAANTPVIWLVQEDCVINGVIEISAKSATGGIGGKGGPGGYRGGNAGNNASEAGQGPGGGSGYNTPSWPGMSGAGSYGSQGGGINPGDLYGNTFLLPLMGGSGGGGRYYTFYGEYFFGGGGGGGSFLLVSSNIVLNGTINAKGGDGIIGTTSVDGGRGGSSGGSGGGVRLVASILSGGGSIHTGGGNSGGSGRIRFDLLDSNFSGSLTGVFTQGFQPIIFPAPGQGIQLSVQRVGGVTVPANPSGVLANPDVIIPAQQANPLPVVVQCSNVPLNTEITVEVRPANGPVVKAVGLNNAGTQGSSTATVSVVMPRGGGLIFAKAVTGINSNSFASASSGAGAASIAQTGWTADGERFVAVEVTTSLGGGQQLAYLTASGKRYKVPAL